MTLILREKKKIELRVLLCLLCLKKKLLICRPARYGVGWSVVVIPGGGGSLPLESKRVIVEGNPIRESFESSS